MADREQPEPSAAERARTTRQRILDAAGREFETTGYGGASVNRIIAAAGATKGAFYHHFASKQHLATTLLRETLEVALPPHDLALQVIVDTGMVLAYRITREPALRAALRLSVAYSAPTTYGTPWPDWIRLNQQQLNDAKEAGELEPYADTTMAAHQIAGAWAGLALITHAVDQSLEHFETRVGAMYKNLLTVVAKPRYVLQVDFSRDRGQQLYEADTAAPPAVEEGMTFEGLEPMGREATRSPQAG
ncbi:TetR family transcriptional regulator [Streptomyces sp. NPDC059582]|uniref:TetR family transcriptional regulator n=1 Tax=Streptomyces sp. NPDC059582 TaxID=3346875 RepID=UPI0036B26C82